MALANPGSIRRGWGVGTQPGERPPPPRRRVLVQRWILATLGLACLVLVILAVLASHYQPIEYGSSGNSMEAFPGIPTGKGIRMVNNFGMLHEDFYIPPQRGTFSLYADIRNNGTHAVTIVSVSLPPGSGLTLNGPVRYSTAAMDSPDLAPGSVSRPLRHGIALGGGQEMLLGFPVKMWWPCGQSNTWQSLANFNVTMRYLVFTHTVAVPWGSLGDSLIMRWPGGKPGQKGVICAPGTTRANLPKVPAQNPGPQPVAGTIIRIYQGHDTGELRLVQMTEPDAVMNVGAALPPCFTQYPSHVTRLPQYRVVNFDLNYASINEGTIGTAPDVKVTITGPDGTPMIVGMPNTQGITDTISCQAAESFLLTSGGHNSQEVLGLTLRVPLHLPLDHLLVTANGHTITVPLVPDCSRTSSDSCFDGSSLGGPWIAGTPYSMNLRI
jgi:hypothetical protein